MFWSFYSMKIILEITELRFTYFCLSYVNFLDLHKIILKKLNNNFCKEDLLQEIPKSSSSMCPLPNREGIVSSVSSPGGLRQQLLWILPPLADWGQGEATDKMEKDHVGKPESMVITQRHCYHQGQFFMSLFSDCLTSLLPLSLEERKKFDPFALDLRSATAA